MADNIIPHPLGGIQSSYPQGQVAQWIPYHLTGLVIRRPDIWAGAQVCYTFSIIQQPSRSASYQLPGVNTNPKTFFPVSIIIQSILAINAV